MIYEAVVQEKSNAQMFVSDSFMSCFSDDLPKPKSTDMLPKGVESVTEYSAYEERDDGRRWRIFRIGEQDHRVDMRAIEPYKRVISHGGQ